MDCNKQKLISSALRDQTCSAQYCVVTTYGSITQRNVYFQQYYFN